MQFRTVANEVRSLFSQKPGIVTFELRNDSELLQMSIELRRASGIGAERRRRRRLFLNTTTSKTPPVALRRSALRAQHRQQLSTCRECFTTFSSKKEEA